MSLMTIAVFFALEAIMKIGLIYFLSARLVSAFGHIFGLTGMGTMGQRC
jgi:hypothetical protein